MNALDAAQVTRLLVRPGAPGKDTAQRIAAINARLDYVVTDHDLEVIAAIYQAPETHRAAVRTAIEPRVASLYSSKQRVRLQAILDSQEAPSTEHPGSGPPVAFQAGRGRVMGR